MNNSSQKPKGEVQKSQIKEEQRHKKNETNKLPLSSSKSTFKRTRKQEEDTPNEIGPKSKRLKEKGEKRLLSEEKGFHLEKTVSHKEKGLIIPTQNSSNILINNLKDQSPTCLKHKRKRSLKRKTKAKAKKEEPKAIEEEPSIKPNDNDGQYTLRKRKDDERVDFNLINCHQCHQIGMLNQMLTCRNERCRESYCFNCIQKHYIKNASKLNLLTMRLGSWKCFKCKGECKCDNCLKANPVLPIEQTLQKVVISIESKKRTKRRVVRRSKSIQPKRPKPLPKIKHNIVTINGMPIIEFKDFNEIDRNEALQSSLSKPFNAMDEQRAQRESHLVKVKHLCESINYETYFQIKKRCSLCKFTSLQSNEMLIFSSLSEFIDYLSYLFNYKIEAMSYNHSIFHQNMLDIARKSKKSSTKKQLSAYPKVICKACLMIKLNQPHCLDSLIYTRKHLSKSASKLNAPGLSKKVIDSVQKQNKPQRSLNEDSIESEAYFMDKDLQTMFPHKYNNDLNENTLNPRDLEPIPMMNTESGYFISRRDVDIFLNYNKELHESVKKINALIFQLNQDIMSNELTLDKINLHASSVTAVYHAYQSVNISYSKHHNVFLKNVDQLINYISSNYPFFEDIKQKILETKSHFETITSWYFKLLQYLDTSVQYFMQLINSHYQYCLNELNGNSTSGVIQPSESNAS